MAEKFRVRPSKLAGLPELNDEIAALDFDRACFIRLELHDVKRKQAHARMMSLAFLSAQAGQLLEFEGDKNISDEEMENFINSIPTHKFEKVDPKYHKEMVNGVEVW